MDKEKEGKQEKTRGEKERGDKKVQVGTGKWGMTRMTQKTTPDQLERPTNHQPL